MASNSRLESTSGIGCSFQSILLESQSSDHYSFPYGARGCTPKTRLTRSTKVDRAIINLVSVAQAYGSHRPPFTLQKKYLQRSVRVHSKPFKYQVNLA